jgi:creatinine amidohydrolase
VSPAVLLEDMTWLEAEQALKQDTVVVIPLGSAAKEHGPHLRLKNDWTIAEYLKQKVAEALAGQAVVAPTIPYFFYPAFVDYPGSVTLSQQTSIALIKDICLSLSSFGPKRFYVINTGISTLKALRPAQEQLVAHGILLRFTDLEATIAATARQVGEQEGGSHADEIETSMMLYMAPQDVQMEKAVKDFDKSGSGKLSRQRVAGLTYSPSGIWGDATLATAEKGARVVQSLIKGVLNDIEELRKTPFPVSSD